MTVNDAGRRRCIGVDNQVILLADALDLAGVVVQTKVDTLDERQVSADVLVGNRDPSLLHVVGLGEHDVVDHFQLVEQRPTDDAVEIGPRDQPEFLFSHGSGVSGSYQLCKITSHETAGKGRKRAQVSGFLPRLAHIGLFLRLSGNDGHFFPAGKNVIYVGQGRAPKTQPVETSNNAQ